MSKLSGKRLYSVKDKLKEAVEAKEEKVELKSKVKKNK